jgi:hypothetical protein
MQKISSQDTDAFVVDLRSQSISQWYCPTLVVNTVIERSTMDVHMENVTFFAIQVVAHLVASLFQLNVIVAKIHRELHAKLLREQSLLAKTIVGKYSTV